MTSEHVGQYLLAETRDGEVAPFKPGFAADLAAKGIK